MPRFDKLEFDDQRKPAATPLPESSVPEPGAEAPGAESAAEAAGLEPVDWLKRAEGQRRCGHYETALRYYSRALQEDRSLVEGWVGQAQMLILLDECPEAELWARKALELFPAQGNLYAARAQALMRMGDTKRALEASDGAMKQKGQSAYTWMVRGELMAATKQNTDTSCFDKALQSDGDWLVHLEIALIYFYYGSYIKALAKARRAVELASGEYYPWFIQGCCEKMMGMTTQARRSFRNCLDICPNNSEAEDMLRDLERTWFFQRWWNRIWKR